MNNLITKYFEKQKLLRYKKKLENLSFPDGYMENRQVEIDCLNWLVASYFGLAGNPKEYLEGLIKSNQNYREYVLEMKNHNIEPLSEVDRLNIQLRQINFLYHWVYYKKIIGF